MNIRTVRKKLERTLINDNIAIDEVSTSNGGHLKVMVKSTKTGTVVRTCFSRTASDHRSYLNWRSQTKRLLEQAEAVATPL